MSGQVTARSRSRPRSGPGAPDVRGHLLPALIGVTVCLLPFLSPPGPGNTAPADLFMTASIGVAFVWVAGERLQVRLPYAWGVSLMVVGGAWAALHAAAPLGSAVVLAQDALLLLWGATVALGRHDPRIVAAVTRAWCVTAPLYAAVGVLGYVAGVNAISGINAEDGNRASYTFGDPNLAGNYLVVSLFVMLACKRPRRAAVRWPALAVVLLATGLTGSNGALLTLVIGAFVAVATDQWRRSALSGALTVGLALLAAGVLVVVVAPRVDLETLRQDAVASVPVLRDSVGRSNGSTDQRATIVREAMGVFMAGDVSGYGPARTKATLERTQAPYVKEAHNDYLAALLERGVVGALGLVVFAGAVLARCGRLVIHPPPPAYAHLVPRAWLLVVVAPMMATAAAFYETLHFRHLWTWLGLVAALVLAIQDHERRAA